MFEKIVTFLKEVKLEMKKVNWPTRNETLKYTAIVLGVCLVAAIFLGGVDYLFTNFFLNKFFIK